MTIKLITKFCLKSLIISFMLLQEISWRLKVKQKDLADILKISASSLFHKNESKNGLPSKYLFRLKEFFGDKLDLNDIFSDTKLYQNCHNEYYNLNNDDTK